MINESEKVALIRALCERLERGLLELVPRLPKEWDGFEIRELVADSADGWFSMRRRMGVPRVREYNKFLLIQNSDFPSPRK